VASSDSIAVSEQDLDSLAGCLDDNDSLGPDDSASNIAAIVTIDDDPMVFYHEVERMRSYRDVLAARAKRKASRLTTPVPRAPR
jgi:hypothetical protein